MAWRGPHPVPASRVLRASAATLPPAPRGSGLGTSALTATREHRYAAVTRGAGHAAVSRTIDGSLILF